MNLQTLIRNAAEETEYAKFYESYLGRGMYGRSCVGIVGSFSECMKLIGDVTQRLHSEHRNNDQEFNHEIERLMDVTYDSMGRDMIVYWEDLDPAELPEEEPNAVRDAYFAHVCPDCGEGIPRNVAEGESCSNCGHVFTATFKED